MKEGFKFIPPNMFIGMYGGIKKKGEEIAKPKESETKGSTLRVVGADDPDQANPDCLVFVKDTKFLSGKFKTNRINYLIPFFPDYIDYMLKAAPYFFIYEEYLEKLEKYQPIYDISSAFDFLRNPTPKGKYEKNSYVNIDEVNKIITFEPLGEFEDENGMLILPNVKVIKNNYTFSVQAKKSNQRQYAVALNDKLNKNYDMDKLANTLGYCTKGELKQDYVPAPRPLTYNGVEYDFRAEKF